MTEVKNVTIKLCPYHSRETGDCRMTAGGLYIPLLHHIEVYCLTAGYVNCQHYIKGKDLLEKSQMGLLLRESGRRRFVREKKRFAVELRSCDSSGRPLGTAELTAMTIDLGQGGMRLESGKKMAVSSYLSFSFDKEFPIPGLTGLGQVRWSSARTVSDKYEAGLCFIDSQLQNMISTQFEG